jgi:hypothetical protein
VRKWRRRARCMIGRQAKGEDMRNGFIGGSIFAPAFATPVARSKSANISGWDDIFVFAYTRVLTGVKKKGSYA